jgi:PAS domain S-box-containing protein
MNKEKLKVLIVEDNEDDLALVLRELNKGKYEIEYESTDNAAGYKSAIEKKWDIIISDYSLPNFNGFEALKICNKKGIDTPFIIVSGTVGEDIAVDMMKAGAKDYIMKKNLKFLLPAVEREVQDAKIRIEKKQTEIELVESEEKYRALVENMGEGISITDEDEKFIFVNPAAEKIFGVGQGKLKDECLKTFISGVEFEKVKNRTKERRQGKSGVFEEEITLKDGSKKILFVHATPWFDNNNFKGTFAIFTDITERKKAEEALRESEYRFKILAEVAPVGIFRTDDKGFTNYVNPRWCEISKMNFEEAMGNGWLKAVHPEDKDSLIKGWQKATLIKSASSAEYRFIRPDGSIAWVIGRAVPQVDKYKKIIGYIGTITDITERKQSEDALKESEERYRVFINSTNDMAFLKDNDLKYILVNKRNAEFFQKNEKEIIGKTDFDLMPEVFAEKCKETDENALNSNIVVISEEKVGERIYEIHKFRVPLSNNKLGIGGYIRDVTEQKWAEENLRKSEEHYRTLLTAIPDLMFRLDGEGRFIDYHADDSSILFVPPEKFLGKHYKEILPPDVSKKYEKIIREVKRTGEIGKLEYEVKLNNNEMRFYEARVTCYRDECVAIIRDMTEQKKAEKALVESENKYRTIFENVQDVFYRTDFNGIIVEISPSVEKYSGYKREELIGNSVDILYYNLEDRKYFIETLKEKGILVDYEMRFKSKDGNLLYSSANAHILFDVNNNPIGIEGSLRDISERKKIEDILKESEERYRILIETMNEGVILVDNDDTIQFVNRKWCDIYGYEPEEVIGKIGYAILVMEEDRHIILEKNSSRLGLVSDSYELKGLKKSGELIWLNINGTPVKDKTGKVIGSVGIMTDITERKHAEEELKKLSRAVEQSPISIVITDTKGNIEYVNPKFVALTGYLPEEAVGRNPRILKSGETPKGDYKMLWDTILAGNDWVGEFHNKKKNGKLYWESALISPIKNSGGNITHFLAVKEDITEKRQKEIELITAKEKAEESERLKSSFLANMSHELRTPMVGILGFAELMKDIAESTELKNFADNIMKSGKRLLETLNLILDLSRIEAGKLEIKTSEVDIVQLIKEVYVNYINEAEKKNLKILFNTSEEVFISKVDERMLWESINNLINNAIKYTKAGEIQIDVSSDKNKKKAYIKVKDTGIGIPKESQNTIFEEFRQVSEGYSRGFEGTGLGLTITKNFIEKIGGNISVESDIGVGSVFTIELPLLKFYDITAPVKEAKVIIEEEKPIIENKDAYILCVDDDSFTREYLEYIIKDFYKISFANNGLIAIEMSKSNNFSLILMDINLGKGMDGIETARKIRKLPGYEKIPVIAMTAFAMKGEREEFLNSGMNDYISKPFKSIELIEIIDKVIRSIKS